jgi:hypothetical protein
LGKPDKNSFGASDVAEPILIFVLHLLADERRAALAEPRGRMLRWYRAMGLEGRYVTM